METKSGLGDALADASEDAPINVWVEVTGVSAFTVLSAGESRTITGECKYAGFIEFDRRLTGWPTGRLDYVTHEGRGDVPLLAVFDSEADEGPERMGLITDWEIVD